MAGSFPLRYRWSSPHGRVLAKRSRIGAHWGPDAGCSDFPVDPGSAGAAIAPAPDAAVRRLVVEALALVGGVLDDGDRAAGGCQLAAAAELPAEPGVGTVEIPVPDVLVRTHEVDPLLLVPEGADDVRRDAGVGDRDGAAPDHLAVFPRSAAGAAEVPGPDLVFGADVVDGVSVGRGDHQCRGAGTGGGQGPAAAAQAAVCPGIHAVEEPGVDGLVVADVEDLLAARGRVANEGRRGVGCDRPTAYPHLAIAPGARTVGQVHGPDVLFGA